MSSEMLMRAVFMTLGLVVSIVAAAAAAVPSTIEVTGASFAELDEQTGLWSLRGSPVTVRRGSIVVRARSIVYDTRRQIVQATGGVSYSDDSTSLDAPRITVWIADERAVAEDRVVALQSRQGVRITAARLEVFGREKRLLATGSPLISSPDGTLTGDRIEAFGDREELIAEGNARLTFEDIEASAPRVSLNRREGLAVFSGGAVFRQGHNEMRARSVTADLRRRRVTASGGASITVQPQR